MLALCPYPRVVPCNCAVTPVPTRLPFRTVVSDCVATLGARSPASGVVDASPDVVSTLGVALAGPLLPRNALIALPTFPVAAPNSNATPTSNATILPLLLLMLLYLFVYCIQLGFTYRGQDV